MTHDEVAELLGAYALDAVEADEAAAVRAHLDECPRCTAELAEHLEVAGLIANAGVDAPAELWERIAERIDAGRTRPAALHSMETAGDGRRAASAPDGRRPDSAPDGRRPDSAPDGRRFESAPAGRRRWAGWSVATTAAAAAVAAIALLGVQVGHLDNRVGQISALDQRSGLDTMVQAALLDPGHTTVTLTAAGGRGRVGDLVITPGGSAYALNTGMPPLTSGRTYQLWGFVHGRPISLGILGRHPRTVAFAVDPSVVVGTYAVTVEPAGGSVGPTRAPVALSATAA